MYEPIEIPAFDTQFEGIHIYIRNLKVVEIHEVVLDAFPPASPYTSIWHDLDVNGMPMHKDLVGGLYIFFRNQGRENTLALSMDMQVRVRADGGIAAADIFCKTVQFLFDWGAKWAKKNDVQDIYNEPFIMPRFLYSKAHFEAAFPQ